MAAHVSLFPALVRCAALVGAAWCVAGCAPETEPGEVGTLRYGGRVKGRTPLDLLPPVSDADGNVYVLNGAPRLPETHAFVGFAGGGWAASCHLTRGDDFGAHGWVGFAQSRQWYWSGVALVAVSGADGRCHAVLERDPSTTAELQFLAVMPGVRNRSDRASAVAWIKSPSDALPYSAQVDLDIEILTNVVPFSPADAENVSVVGVGGSREQGIGIVLAQYQSGGAPHLEARYYDADGAPQGSVAIEPEPLAPYAVQGYLQIASSGLVAGLVQPLDPKAPPDLVTFTRSSGSITSVTGMSPVGVHLWDGALWLVGTADSEPVIVPIEGDGSLGNLRTWGASLLTERATLGALDVRDDRSLPSRRTTWTGVKTAMGNFPFLHAHALTTHARGTTLWLFAGPTTEGNAFPFTSFATAPVGVAYP